jgi:hypothetical protein
VFLRQQHIFRRQQVGALYWPVPSVLNFYCSRTNKDSSMELHAFYWQAPSNYIYKSAAKISTTAGGPFPLEKTARA